MKKTQNKSYYAVSENRLKIGFLQGGESVSANDGGSGDYTVGGLSGFSSNTVNKKLIRR